MIRELQIPELEKEKVFKEKLTYFLKGDKPAIEYCLNIVGIAHVWDDIVDGANPSYEAVCDAFRIALIDIPMNQFFDQFRKHLLPVMMNAILSWQDSNVLDRGSDHDKHMSFILRASIVEIIAYCVYVVGGPDWARQVGPDIRRLYEEDLLKYMEEMKCH